ncbi:hypothetical protein BpHYR1_001745 [Brachionus plicatilis]|uniref:Uncharacterized protein n=1 Tax=Brachionus plicatilis TaxID=10195 RepID=A0A3M7RC74_BRAPC|nr:hypothetical protein BpHYR1_001745 [Brachionus plicatilis]
MSDSESSSTSILRSTTQNKPGLDTDDEIDSIEVDLKPKRGKSIVQKCCPKCCTLKNLKQIRAFIYLYICTELELLQIK